MRPIDPELRESLASYRRGGKALLALQREVQMKKKRDWKRPVIALAALGALTVAALASPVSAHFVPKHEKKHVRKIARKQINKLVPGIAIEESELVRFGQIKLNVGGSQPIGTFGPFTLTARCVDGDAGADVEIVAQVEITTSEADSFFFSDFWGGEDDFDPNDSNGPILWVNIDEGDAPGDPLEWLAENHMTAHAPGGTSLTGDQTAFTNFAGSHCMFSGSILQESPA
jgi:hypothetical protein